MICSVPSNETINATVTVTNEAGVTTSKSTSAGLLAMKHTVNSNKIILFCFVTLLDALALTCQG